MDDSAKRILIRAVELDNSKRYDESLTCYQEGIALLIDVSKCKYRRRILYRLKYSNLSLYI